MKASELRHGNYCYQKGELGQYDANADYTHLWDVLTPVELSEQWLKDFGFKQNLSHINLWHIMELSFRYDIMHLEFVIIGEPVLFPPEHNALFRIKNIQFVHQLQNLYFALTGNELTK